MTRFALLLPFLLVPVLSFAEPSAACDAAAPEDGVSALARDVAAASRLRVDGTTSAALTDFPDGPVDLAAYRSDEATRRAVRAFYGEAHVEELAREMKPQLRKAGSAVAAIPIEDLVALRLYTKREYHAMNRGLRGRSPEELAELEPAIKAAASALGRMPAFDGTVYRSTHLDDGALAAYQPGRFVTEKAFTSTSQAEVRTYAFPGNVQFVIRSKTGRDVSAIAKSQGEQEVIFPPGARFQVLSREVDRESGRVRIVMAEELSK